MRVTFNNSSNAEFGGICLDVINTTKEGPVEEIKTHVLFQDFEAKFPAFHTRAIRDTTMGMGNQVVLLNRKRVKRTTGLRTLLKQIVKFSNPEQAAAAQAVLDEWLKLKNVTTNHDYDEVTLYMNKSLTLLKSEPISAHLTTLNLLHAVTDIENDEADFQTAYAQQATGNAQLRNEGSASKYRSDLAKALSRYLKYVKAMKEQPGYDLLYANLQEVTKTAAKGGAKTEVHT